MKYSVAEGQAAGPIIMRKGGDSYNWGHIGRMLWELPVCEFKGGFPKERLFMSRVYRISVDGNRTSYHLILS